jgi:hypothetical protein
LQLEWHRQFDKDVPKKSTLTNKALKLEALVAAVERHNSGKAVRSNLAANKSPVDNAMDLDNMDTEEEMEDEDMDLD